MADGVSTTVANSALDNIASANMAAAQLHIGPPGSAGTANVASVTTRPAVTWASASGSAGSPSTKSANGTLPSWPSWAGVNGQTVTAISLWSSTTPGAGTFGGAVTLSASVTMNTGDNLSLTAITISMPTAS